MVWEIHTHILKCSVMEQPFPSVHIQYPTKTTKTVVMMHLNMLPWNIIFIFGNMYDIFLTANR